MPIRTNIFRKDNFYHVYNRGVDKQPIFFEPENYAFFLKRQRHYFENKVEVIAYVLMPNHYHLLIRLLDDNFSQVMQRLTMSYVNAVNKSRTRVGPLFQSRFQTKLVGTDEYLLHLSRYIHINPVEAGIVKTPITWNYSSYPEFIGTRAGTLPRPDIVLSLFQESSGFDKEKAQKNYKKFVESYQEEDISYIKHLIF